MITGFELKIKSAPRKFPSLSPPSPPFPLSSPLPFPFPPFPLPLPNSLPALRRKFLKIKSPVARKTHFQNIKTFLRRRSSLSLSPCLFLNSWSEIKPGRYERMPYRLRPLVTPYRLHPPAFDQSIYRTWDLGPNVFICGAVNAIKMEAKEKWVITIF